MFTVTTISCMLSYLLANVIMIEISAKLGGSNRFKLFVRKTKTIILMFRYIYQPNTTDPEIVAELNKNNCITISAISRLCITVIKDQFERLCKPL